jgi:hypothetical protein
MNRKLFMVFFIFILVAIVVSVTGKYTETMLFISMLANLFIIYTHCNDHPETPAAGQDLTAPVDMLGGPSESVAPPTPPEDAYGEDYRQHAAYDAGHYHIDKYARVGNADDAAVDLARQRTRDKRSMDGALTKDANYYAYHYGDELDAEEKKRWWGNHEY